MHSSRLMILAVLLLILDSNSTWGREIGSHRRLGGHLVSGSISVETRKGDLFDIGYGDSGGGITLQVGYGRFVRNSPLLIGALFESNSQRHGDYSVQDWSAGPGLTFFASRRWEQGTGKPFFSAAWLYQDSSASLRGADLSGGGSSLRLGLGWLQIIGDVLVGTLEVNHIQERMRWNELGDESGRRIELRIGLAGVIGQTWR